MPMPFHSNPIYKIQEPHQISAKRPFSIPNYWIPTLQRKPTNLQIWFKKKKNTTKKEEKREEILDKITNTHERFT
jgi:hypothetical protein